jgi:Doubled CXXCH motif (Paired_CXXCH_1)
MKRLTLLLTGVMMVGVVALAAAGDFHVGTTLICSDCHVAHYSQSHGYSVGGLFTPLGAGGPFNNLLRDDENKVCLACHNGQSFAPDVFGANGGTQYVREAGGLNAAAGNGLSNDVGYDETNGHTLYSTAMPPGSTGSAYVPSAIGLRCIDCHAQHGVATQYRNLLNRGIFTGDSLTYAIGTNDLTKDVFERTAGTMATAYSVSNIDFNEPNTHASRYGNWCKACHTQFHGAGGDANMGGLSGGVTSTNATPWKRHPTADVNIGESGSAGTFISSLSQYAGHVNKVKVMDSQGLWTGTSADNTITPSCMSCHKAHGNMNGFGLIFMNGSGTVTEEGDGGVYKDLCRQCHTEGA